MCIRDRFPRPRLDFAPEEDGALAAHLEEHVGEARRGGVGACLLYTSDAADERSSVDLGGRRIIKKKSKQSIRSVTRRMKYQDTKEYTAKHEWVREKKRSLQEEE